MDRRRGVIWDFVGTLVAVREPVGETYARLARTYSIVADPERIVQRLKKALLLPPPLCNLGSKEIEESQRWWRGRVAYALDLPEEKLPPSLFRDLWDYYAQPCAWQLLPGAQELLDRFSRQGIRMAILSHNDSRLFRLVPGLKIPVPKENVFPTSLLPWAKPDPRAFLYVARSLDLPLEEILVVDDDPGNREVARSLGFLVADLGSLV